MTVNGEYETKEVVEILGRAIANLHVALAIESAKVKQLKGDVERLAAHNRSLDEKLTMEIEAQKELLSPPIEEVPDAGGEDI